MPVLAETTVDVGSIVSIVKDGGIIGLLIVIFWGGVKKWWVYGWMYQQTLAELEEWKRMALSGTALAERAVEVYRAKDGGK